MARTIDIRIATTLQDKGVQDARKELERLLKAVQDNARAQPGLSAAAERSARAQQQAALAAQKLATEQGRSAQAAANAAAAQARAEAANLRLATAQDRATQAVKRTSDGLAILPRSFAGVTDEVRNQITTLASWGVALGAAGTLVRSFADAFTFGAQLDATTRSIEIQLRGVRDSAQVFAEAERFGSDYAFTQSEMSSVIANSVPILRNSSASFTDLAGVLARLQVLAPGKTIEDAAFSVRELASGDITSIAEQFNISRQSAYEMRDAIAAGADVVQVLQKYLNDSGVSMETLTARTQGAQGALNDLKRAQEELTLAQADFAAGPGLVFLEKYTELLRGVTRLFGWYRGEVESITELNRILGQSQEEASRNAMAQAAAQAAFIKTLQETGNPLAAVDAAAQAFGETLIRVATNTYPTGEAMGDAADATNNLTSALGGAGSAAPAAANAIAQAAAGPAAVAQAAREAQTELQRMFAIAGTSVPGASIGGTNTAAGGSRSGIGSFGGAAAGAASAAARSANVIATASAPRGGPAIPKRSGGGGGGGASAAERAAQQAADIAQRAEDNAREYAKRQEDAAEDRAERLADIEVDKGKRLAEIDKDTAERLADIAEDSAQKVVDLNAQASKKIRDNKKAERAALKAIDEQIARDREEDARGLANDITSGGLQARLRSVSDNLDLAGSGNDFAAREAAQAAAEQARAAAAARAQAESDPAVGRAVFQAELANIQAREDLDQQYAERKAELAGNPEALRQLDAYYAQIIAAQRDATEQEINEARQAADLKAQEAEAQRQAVREQAAEERRAIEAERRAQTEAVIKEAEKQRAETVAKAEQQKAETVAKAQEQAAEVEKAYQKQQDAIREWADEVERDLDRVIDKAGQAAAAVAAVPGGAGSTGSSAAAASGAGGGLSIGGPKAEGGPVDAGTAYPVGEKGREWFVPYVNGAIIPNEAGAMGGASVTVNIYPQPGMDPNAIADVVMRRLNQQVRLR